MTSQTRAASQQKSVSASMTASTTQERSYAKMRKNGMKTHFTQYPWHFFYPSAFCVLSAFSRRFYPKRLTVHSGYTFVCQYVFPGN